MPRQRKQSGYIYQRAGWWVLRYRENVIENGQVIRKQMAKQLAPVAPEHTRLKRAPKAIEQEAEKFLWPVNDGESKPEQTQTIGTFAESLFFPHLKERVRESTYRGYLGRWESQLKPRCADIRLRDFRVLSAQQVIDAIHRQNSQMKYSTLAHLKNLLSLIFDEAERLEVLPKGAGNPVKLVRLPDAPEDDETYAYSLREIETMLAVIPEPAATVCAVAAFTGLRRAELRGLQWEDYNGKQLMVNRSIWEGFTNEPKTKRSKAAVPVIPRLAEILDRHRLACGNPPSGPMFANSRGKSANLNNTLNRKILPALNRCVACLKAKADHVRAGVSHDFSRDDNLPRWHGWHAFRRGLASTLYGLGVDDVMVQQILRHKDVQVTRDHYIKTSSDQSVAAMAKLESAFGELCADRALIMVPAKNTLPC
jgi:integrase